MGMLDKYVFKHLADKLAGATPDQICSYYVKHFIFGNEGYLDYLIKEYKLPKNDILKIHAGIVALAP